MLLKRSKHTVCPLTLKVEMGLESTILDELQIETICVCVAVIRSLLKFTAIASYLPLKLSLPLVITVLSNIEVVLVLIPDFNR